MTESAFFIVNLIIRHHAHAKIAHKLRASFSHA